MFINLNRFKTSRLAKAISSLFLDFTATNTLDSRVTFSRTSNATVTNSAGLIVSSPINSPRFDYNPVTLQPRGLLIEGQRVNLFTFSEEFDNAGWSKSNSTVSANVITSPDGTIDADKLVENTSTTEHFVTRSVAVVSGTTYSMSVFAKQAESGRFLTLLFGGGTYYSGEAATFNLSTGVVTNTSGVTTATISSVGNGWYRCSISAISKATGTPSGAERILLNNSTSSSSFTYAGDGTSGIYIWGAQIEAGAFVTSYIPTQASQVTRTVDTALITGTNFSSWYNSTEGTIYTTTELPSSFTSFTNSFIYMFDRNTGSLGPRIQLAANPSLQTLTSAVVNDSSTVVAQLVGTGSRTALAYKVNDFAQSVNGASSASDTSGALPTGIIALRIGSNSTNATSLNGHIKQITYYNTRLPNETLQAITS